MSRCKTVSLFYALIPLRGWRGYLIRRHIEGCAHCQSGLASRADSRSLFIQEAMVSFGGSLWTAVESGLAAGTGGPTKASTPRAPVALRARGWAVAAALLIALVAGFWIIKDFRSEVITAAATAPEHFELAYVRIEGQPANTVIYQPQGSDMIIVWAGKSE